MCGLSSYQVGLSGLSDGVHHRDFHLDDAYFEMIGSDVIKGGSVRVALEIRRAGAVFTLFFHSEGEVTVTCDLCLDDMRQVVNADGQLTVKFGQAANSEDDSIMIDENDGEIDLSWLMYEQIALAIPIRHVHAPEDCNADMIRKLDELSASAERNGQSGEKAIDQRWEKLRHLKIED